MPDASWKRDERQVASALGGERNPLSGSASRHTAGDVIHPTFYVECKRRKRWSVWALYEDVKRRAEREGKVPLLTLKQYRKQGHLVVLSLADFVHIWLKALVLERLNAQGAVAFVPEEDERRCDNALAQVKPE